MPELFTPDLISESLKRLNAAFPRNIGKQNPEYTFEVYKTGLRGLSPESIKAAVDRSIQDEEYFPKVSKLRELAHNWAKYNQAADVARFETDPLWCRSCQTKAAYERRWRVRTAERFGGAVLVLNDEQTAVLLEDFERLLCQCAPKSPYQPDVGFAVPMVRLIDLSPTDKRRLVDEEGRRARPAQAMPSWSRQKPLPAGGNISDVAETIAVKAAEAIA
jgi:hypothetical protein